MKILVAPDSYKGSLTAIEVADVMEEGIKKACPMANVIKKPIADGGEGTVETILNAIGGSYQHLTVTGPTGKPIEAKFGILSDQYTAVIEIASASGLMTISAEDRNPLMTTSYGTGEIIKKALDKGCRKLVIGLGGSATNDGGVGMAQAVGIRFLDDYGREIGLGGERLTDIALIDVSGLDPRIQEAELVIASDVNNVLCGEDGASAVFAPQKGATPEMVDKLDRALQHLATVIKKQLDIDIANTKGAGAAGGLGAGLMAFLNAQMHSGIATVFEFTKIENDVKIADLIITGEGQTDQQSVFGKVPYGIGNLAQKYHKPVICISGSVTEGAEKLYDHGVKVVIGAVQSPMSLEDAIFNSKELVMKATERTMRAILIGNKISCLRSP